MTFQAGQDDPDGPCVIICHNGWNRVYSFQSGEINALACDGSGRSLKGSVDETRRSVLSKAGGEILNADLM